MYFVKNGKKIFICTDFGVNIFELINAYIMTEENEKTYLNFFSAEKDSIQYSLPEIGAEFKVSVVCKDSTFALRFTADYLPQNLFSKKGNIHFYEENAVGLELKPCNIEKFTAIYRGSEWWSRVMFSDDFSSLPLYTQSLMFAFEKKRCFISAFCHNGIKSNFKGEQNGVFSLYAYDNCRSNSCDGIVALLSFGQDFKEMIYQTVYSGFTLAGKKPLMRKDRLYPEILNYLGFCSWDAFNIEVSEEKLISKVEEFENKNIPVKWFMIDDMWGDVKNNKIGVNSTRELYSFKADKDRFPNGLDSTVSKLHNLGLKVGLWYPTTGYWNGIDPNGEIAEEERFKDLIFWSQEGMLVHKFDENSIKKYYYLQNEYYGKCGIDFIKVDNQACLRRFSKRVMKIGKAAENLHKAIENAADTFFGGSVINCMGMSLENYWNRQSGVTRISCDFLPESRERFNLTIRQSAFNSLFYGPVYYGDYDMWWTYDSQKLKNAVSHSISGGPVYISDELGKTDFEIIKPLIFSDGRIIRMPSPALPCDDCMFEDSATSGKPFKIYNRDGKNGVVIAYNITENGKGVRGFISAADAELDRDMTYVAYDVFGKNAVTVKGDDRLDVLLNGGDDFKMLLFVPLENGSAVIGLKDKYVCFEGIKDKTVLDDGALLLYNRDFAVVNGVKKMADALNGGLFELPVCRGDRIE